MEQRGHLVITIVGARGLEKKGMLSGKPDTYVTVSLFKQKIKTKIVRQSIAPTWDYEFKIQLPHKMTKNEVIAAELLDHSRFTADRCLGRVEVTISDVPEGEVKDEWLQLYKKKEKGVTDDKNEKTDIEIRLKILYYSTEEKVSLADFDLLAVLGKGKFGKVMQVKKKDNQQVYAMKVLRKEVMMDGDMIEHLKSEAQIMKTISHPYTISLKYSFQDEQNLYFVMDYISGGELFFHLRKEGVFKEDRVKFYASQLVLAIAHLHTHNIIYRDLKPENILLDKKGNIRLTDFGLSKEVDPEKLTNTVCGTSYCFAPELLKKKGYGKDVDWWALGIIMYEMLTGLPPFYSENKNSMFQKILTEDPKYPKFISNEAQHLMASLLQKDPTKRLGYGKEDGELVKAHPFFKGVDWDKLLRKDIKAPFKPKVKDDSDLSQFDQEFTREKPQIENTNKTFEDFEGFSFVNSALADGLIIDGHPAQFN